MIILDSCILRGISVHDSRMDLLRTIRRLGVERVSVPWMVLEELAAQKALQHQEAHAEAVKAVNKLTKATPWPLGELAQEDAERVREHWRSEYQKVVEVIPTSENALREAMRREANGEAPCKISPRGSGKAEKVGGRDAAIWLSVVEYAEGHPDEVIYFVSSNTRDFGTGDTYLHPMNEDLRDIGSRFTHFTSLDDVVNRFASPVESDRDATLEVVSSCASRNIIADAAAEWAHRRNTPFECSLGDSHGIGFHTPITATGWADVPAVKLASLDHVETFEIGDHKWSTGTARWFIGGNAFTGHPIPGTLNFVICTWETRILFSSDAMDSGLAILRECAGPSPFRTDDEVSEAGGLDSWPGVKIFGIGASGEAPLNLVQPQCSCMSATRLFGEEWVTYMKIDDEGTSYHRAPALPPG
ncbi:PIN domain-containing protein [Streptomyces sioyaensis]|uniref:PIN domain-containing protein n=1 Tax=Streptomyces sioyaensis TaxID=67364 RepID=UPI003D757583